jgi:NADH-quinone oxidoreductase subunit L
MPFFAGYYSKEHIIEAAAASTVWGSSFGYYATLLGVFVTSLYSFRVYFLVFHGKERFNTSGENSHGHDGHDHDDHSHHGGKPHESPWVVTLPLTMLAIPSVFAGALLVEPLLFGGYFKDSIVVLAQHPAMATIAKTWHGWLDYALNSVVTVPFWLMVAGAVVAWYCYLINPKVPAAIQSKLKFINCILENKYFFDWMYEQVFARGSRLLGKGLWQQADRGLIDGLLVNGSAKVVGAIAAVTRRLQTGFIYHYAFAMIIGLMAAITYIIFGTK